MSDPLTTQSSSWLKATKSPEAWEVMIKRPIAYRLAQIIGWRARWSSGFNVLELEQGEALLGDWKACGMTEREYRTAKQQLSEWGFATFTATPRGTIAKLTDTRLFDYSPIVKDDQNDGQTTDRRRTDDGQTTTNQTVNRQKPDRNQTETRGEGSSPTGKLKDNQRISLEKLVAKRSDELKRLRDSNREEKTPEKIRQIRELEQQITSDEKLIRANLPQS